MKSVLEVLIGDIFYYDKVKVDFLLGFKFLVLMIYCLVFLVFFFDFFKLEMVI